jgi:hypothetical protein
LFLLFATVAVVYFFVLCVRLLFLLLSVVLRVLRRRWALFGSQTSADACFFGPEKYLRVLRSMFSIDRRWEAGAVGSGSVT